MNKYHTGIIAYLSERDETLTCDKFTGMLNVSHADGSYFALPNSIVEEKKFGDFDVLLVWTEHCGYFFFFKDDLNRWDYYPDRE
jgi:hypothetical protein